MIRQGIRVLGEATRSSTTWQTKAKTRRGPRGDHPPDAAYTPVGQVGPAYMKRKRDAQDRDLSLVSLLSLPDEELIVALREVGIFTPICPCGAEVKPAPYLKEAGGVWYWQCSDRKECHRRVPIPLPLISALVCTSFRGWIGVLPGVGSHWKCQEMAIYIHICIWLSLTYVPRPPRGKCKPGQT